MAIDVAEARQILGKDAESFSDEEIQRMLASLYVLANDLLDLSEEGIL